MPQPSVTEICLKITYLKFYSNFPGVNKLIVLYLVLHLAWPMNTSYQINIKPVLKAGCYEIHNIIKTDTLQLPKVLKVFDKSTRQWLICEFCHIRKTSDTMQKWLVNSHVIWLNIKVNILSLSICLKVLLDTFFSACHKLFEISSHQLDFIKVIVSFTQSNLSGKINTLLAHDSIITLGILPQESDLHAWL